jgi:hypothetical protein
MFSDMAQVKPTFRKKRSKTPKENFHVYLTIPLADTVRVLAEKERRSVTNLIEILVEEALTLRKESAA